MAIPCITALTAMISAVSTYPVVEYVADLSLDEIPCIVISSIETTEFGHQTVNGSATITLVAMANELKTHSENIKDHTEGLYRLASDLKELHTTVGYLIDPTISWNNDVERTSESMEVTNTDILTGSIKINFGLSA
jgi:hypothetical protein